MADRLVNVIINKLKTGSIPSVVMFSDTGKFPEIPYVVVKPEPGVEERTPSYRIIAHMAKGQADALEDYVLIELDQLLLEGGLKDSDGSGYKLFVNGFTDITPNQTDDSYYMERMYFTPLLIRS